jgi:nucleotide-binding universal stress UspA family protein
VKKIYFTHIIKNLSLPAEVLEKFPDLMDRMLQEKKEEMIEEVGKYFPRETSVEISYVVKEGNLSKKVLKLAESKSIDLILIGKKELLPGTGVACQRMARRASCSLFIIPEQAKVKLSKLIVPSDFSDFSKNALEEAIQIAKKNGEGSEIIFQNVFTIPSGYHFTGKSYEEFSEVLQKHAEATFKKFIRKIDTKGVPITPMYTKDDDDNPVHEIVEAAVFHQADGIIIGAKGKTASTALLIGSMAERLIQFNTRLPLLLVRPKGKNAGILDYLVEI